MYRNINTPVMCMGIFCRGEIKIILSHTACFATGVVYSSLILSPTKLSQSISEGNLFVLLLPARLLACNVLAKGFRYLAKKRKRVERRTRKHSRTYIVINYRFGRQVIGRVRYTVSSPSAYSSCGTRDGSQSRAEVFDILRVIN